MKDGNRKLALVLLACVAVLSVVTLVVNLLVTSREVLSSGSYSIVISEICTKNETVIADNDGKYRDYIELYNSGEPVSLEGFTLTDGKVSCSPFGSAILGTGEYRVVFLGNSLTGFGLGASGGDCIQLRDPSGSIVAQANTATMVADQVMLYRGGIYDISYEASPGYANTNAGVAAFRQGSPAKDPALVISEVLIGNEVSLPDERGMYADVVEIRNLSEETVNLSGWCLSDSMDQRHRYRLPDMEIPGGGYAVIFCDGQNYLGEDGQIHANFSLSHGETLVLTDPMGEYTRVQVQYCGDDVSQGRLENGSYEASFVSLGFPNTQDGALQFSLSRIREDSPLLISEVLLSSADVPYDGSFCDVVEICNNGSSAVSTTGWYLSDGGDPYEYPLPEKSLQPGECMVIVCGPQTTGFSLSEGEILRLTGPDYRHAPEVVCTEPPLGMSISLRLDGGAAAYAFDNVTLGYENTQVNHGCYRLDQLKDGLRISEVMTANLSYLQGPYATTADWVELYNGSGSPIRLSDYCLTDNSSDPDRYPLPDLVLEAGEYCVIFLKSDRTNLLPGYPVLPFAISSAGDQLYLTRREQIVDYVHLPELATDEAYGRPAGDGAFTLLRYATPGYANTTGAEKCAMPTADIPQGSYDDVDCLEIRLSGEGTIYYTTDCTTPDANAIRYTGPIRLTQTTVLRVVCRQTGRQDSDVLNLTYLINENDNLPVVSLVTDPDNLWSAEKGIYVPGPNAQPAFPHFGANYWMGWERPASVSLLEPDGSGFQANCGIKIFGGYTIALPKKSLSCIFRDVYGAGDLVYPLFGEGSLDSYGSFVLRSAGQDAQLARMRDVVVTSLFSDYTDVPVQDYKPVILYLNGEYWGLFYIREKITSNYLAGHYNVPPDTLSVVKLGGWTCPEYIDLVKYTASHDMTDPECYNYVCSRIDVDNYIDFIIAEMWIANTDSGNVKYFKNPEGKWTWFLYDTDMALMDYAFNSVNFYLNPTGIGTDDFTCKTFVYKLMQNEEFRDKFLHRMAWQMNNIWTEENVITRVDEIVGMIGPDMPRECARWGTSYAMWETNVEEIREFARNRSSYLLTYIQEWFGLTDQEMRDYGFAIR